jgi:hypothetical protein
MGTRRPGVERGECNTTRRCQVLYGSGAVCAPLRERDLEPDPNHAGTLEGLHIRAAYRMARKHKPRKGLFGNLIYPLTKDVLKECGLCPVPVKDYIDTRRSKLQCMW